MPWRLIAIVLIFGVFLAFITFNLENRCDISFGFFKVRDIPVFLTIFISFTFGLLCALPFAMHRSSRKENKPVKDEIERVNIPSSDGGFHGGV